MTLFGRKKKWPSGLERRQPENAAKRKRRDQDDQEKVKVVAQLVTQQTTATQYRIDKIAEILKRRES